MTVIQDRDALLGLLTDINAVIACSPIAARMLDNQELIPSRRHHDKRYADMNSSTYLSALTVIALIDADDLLQALADAKAKLQAATDHRSIEALLKPLPEVQHSESTGWSGDPAGCILQLAGITPT